MRICIVDRAYGSRQIPALAPALRSLGHEVDVIESPWRSSMYGGGAGMGRALRAMSEHRGAGAALAKVLFGFYAHTALRWRGRFDILHVEEPVVAGIALQRPWRNRPPLVLSTMGPMPPVDLLQAAASHERTALITSSWDVGGFAAKVALAQMRFNLQHAGAVIVNSEALRDSIELSFAPRRRIEVIPTGIDVNLFAPGDRVAARERLGFAADEFVLLSVGGISPRKGQLQLVQALARLRDRLPIRLLLVGPASSTAYAAALVKEARSLGVGELVRMTGAVEHDQLPCYYRAADAFALMSDAEGMPESLLEAMACGLACLASDIPNNREAAPCRDEAVFVDRGDVDGIAKAIYALAIDPSSRRRLGEKASASVRETFAWDRLVPRFVQVYEQVLGR